MTKRNHSLVIAFCESLAYVVLTKHPGSVGGGTLTDCHFKPDYVEGPFSSITAFNDWLAAAATRQRPGPDYIADLYREYMPDIGNIQFTHGDLTLGNIMISGGPGSRRIAAIIDWEQSGW